MASESDNEVPVTLPETAPEATDNDEAPKQRPEVTEGLKIRAVIDGEVVKGLLLINGGGAVAMLAFLQVVLGKPQYNALANAVLNGLMIFALGLVFAIAHNRLRRLCSHKHDLHNYDPPGGKLLWFKLKKPTVCWWSEFFMTLSLLAFLVAVTLIFLGGRESLNNPPAKETTAVVRAYA